MKRLISLALCFLMIVNVLPVKTFAEEEQSLEEIIRPQVEAFAKSIDQKNADGKAQDTLISHGISGGGKKLSVGKSSALTATLMNSEFAKYYITTLCAEMIEVMDEIDRNELFSLGNNCWRTKGDNFYRRYIFDYNASFYKKENEYYTPNDYLKASDYYCYYTKSNGYDESLELIVGGAGVDLDIKLKEIQNNKSVYEISVIYNDIFNFDTDNSSTLEDLLGWIGMLLFEPFEWESTFDFQIEIPIEKPEENEIFGDFDGSGKVDVSDAYFARLVAAKLVEPTPEQLALCDVDRDGRITAIDANLIRKYAAGIIESLPIR